MACFANIGFSTLSGMACRGGREGACGFTFNNVSAAGLEGSRGGKFGVFEIDDVSDIEVVVEELVDFRDGGGTGGVFLPGMESFRATAISLS